MRTAGWRAGAAAMGVVLAAAVLWIDRGAEPAGAAGGQKVRISHAKFLPAEVTVIVRAAGRVVVVVAGRAVVVVGRTVVVVTGSFGGGVVVSGLAGATGVVVVVDEGEPVVVTVSGEPVVTAPSPADATVVDVGVPPHPDRAASATSAETRALFTLSYRHRPAEVEPEVRRRRAMRHSGKLSECLYQE